MRDSKTRGIRRGFDEEDVALSAFYSLCKGVQNGNFPKLEDRDNLWSLLVVITARKAIRNIRVATAQKRGSGRVLGESALNANLPPDEDVGFDQIIGNEPTEEFAQRVSEECEHLLSLLPDAEMRKLALLKMEGCSNAQVARELGYGVRTVERRLGLLRRIWQDRGEKRRSASFS